MKAVIIKEHGLAALADIEVPKLPPDFIKIKTVAVAINPTDCDHCAGVGRVGGILGCDVSGIVEEVGEDCKSDVKKGDRVYGVCHTANNNSDYDGAFAEYAMVRDGHIAKIPDHVSFEEAATLGVGITSVGQALYMTLKLPLPGEEPLQGAPFFLVSGGSTATGTLAIQFAKLSGLRVIATASPHSFELVKSRGAEAAFDYNDPECAKLIREYTKGELHYILECIGTESSYDLVAKALPETVSEPVHIVSLLPTHPWPRQDITPTWILAYTTFGKPFTKFGIDFPANPAHFDYGVMFWKLSQKLLEEGKIKPHPVAMRKGGLSGIPDGITEFASGKVRAQKLVFRVAETGDVQNSQRTAVQVREFATKW